MTCLVFLTSYITVVSIVSICLVCDFSIVGICPSISAARFAFCLCFILFLLLFRVVSSGEPKQNQGQGLIDRKLVQAAAHLAPPPPHHQSNFIAGCPKAALLFWFFGDFRCSLLLFMFILIIYKYKNRYK